MRYLSTAPCVAVFLLLPRIVEAMPLDAAVSQALLRAPSLRVSDARIEQADARVHQAGAAQWLTASMSLGGLVQNEILFNFGNNIQLPFDTSGMTFPDIVIQPGSQWQGNIQATQPLLVPAAWAARKAASEASDVAVAGKAVDQTRVVLAVVEAWHTSARAHALLDDAVRTEKLAGEVLTQADGLVRTGVAAADSLLTVQSSLATAHANVARTKALVDSADASLSMLTGLPGSAADPIAVPEDARSVETWLAAIDRPDLQAAHVQVEAARAAEKATRATRLPVVGVTGNVTWLDPPPALGDNWNWRAMLGATVPLVQGGAVATKVREAHARVDEAQAGERTLREVAELDVRRAHGNLVASLASLGESEAAVMLSEKAVVAAQLRLKEGGGSVLAVDQAQATLAAAQMRLTTARCDAAVAWDRLRLATWGTLVSGV
jgi:outer membrane protein